MITIDITEKEKAIELADKYGISTAIDIASELFNEVSQININSNWEMPEPINKLIYWDIVKKELNKLEY